MLWGERRDGGREEEGQSLSHSHTASHTLSPNAISPECQAEMRGGADKKTVCACVCVCWCVSLSPSLSSTPGRETQAQISLYRHDRICSLCNLIILTVR